MHACVFTHVFIQLMYTLDASRTHKLMHHVHTSWMHHVQDLAYLSNVSTLTGSPCICCLERMSSICRYSPGTYASGCVCTYVVHYYTLQTKGCTFACDCMCVCIGTMLTSVFRCGDMPTYVHRLVCGWQMQKTLDHLIEGQNHECHARMHVSRKYHIHRNNRLGGREHAC